MIPYEAMSLLWLCSIGGCAHTFEKDGYQFDVGELSPETYVLAAMDPFHQLFPMYFGPVPGIGIITQCPARNVAIPFRC